MSNWLDLNEIKDKIKNSKELINASWVVKHCQVSMVDAKKLIKNLATLGVIDTEGKPINDDKME